MQWQRRTPVKGLEKGGGGGLGSQAQVTAAWCSEVVSPLATVPGVTGSKLAGASRTRHSRVVGGPLIGAW